MKRIYFSILGVVVLLMGFNTLLKAQDIHFSQFYNSPLNLNPALTGIFNGDMRFIGGVRDQWRSVPAPYLTFSGNYDQKVYLEKLRSGFFGVGVVFNYDNAGDGNFNVSDLRGSFSYSHMLHKHHVLTGGITLGVASEGFTTDGALTWDNYWTGEVIDPSKGTGEPLLSKERFTYLETGAGINYRFQKSKRTNFNLGVGAYHLNQPKATFSTDSKSRLPMRFSISGVGSFKIINPLDIQLHALASLQGKYSEYVGGGLARIHINRNRGKEAALDLGASVRLSNGFQAGFIAPTIALHYKRFYIGANYDINMTQFVSDFSNLRRGGPEVHFRYVITNVKPLSQKKACPIF